MTSAGQPAALGLPAFTIATPEPLSFGRVLGKVATGAIPGLSTVNGLLGYPLGLSPIGPAPLSVLSLRRR